MTTSIRSVHPPRTNGRWLCHTAMAHSTARRFRLRHWLFGGLAVFVTLVVALLVAVALYDWNNAKGYIAEKVKERTGRDLFIGDLQVHPFSLHPRIQIAEAELSNADWGEKRPMIVAETVDFRVSLLPLLAGRVVFPDVSLGDAEILLQQDAEGRRNWVLKPDEEKTGEPVQIGRLTVDRGRLAVKDAMSKTDVVLDVQTTQDATYGIEFAAKGRVTGYGFETKGAGGGLLSIKDEATPYPLKLAATIGEARATFEGTITGLVSLAAVEGKLGFAGRNLSDLAEALKLSFPDTAPYKVAGTLKRDGNVWSFGNFRGTVGKSDLRGEMSVDVAAKRPTLKGKLRSDLLDIADLGGLIGEKPGEPDPKPAGKILPAEPVNLEKLRRIDADVTLTATRFRNADKLPLDDLNMRIVLVDGVMKADPADFGVAGGKVTSRVAVDSRNNKALAVDINTAFRQLHLNKLVPGTDLLDQSFGAVDGKVQLKGHGNSAAGVLGTSNGRIDIVSRGGEMSNLLAEVAGLDGAEIVKFFVGGDQNIQLRCGIAAFNVKDGVMASEAFVIDTDDTYIGGQGTISLRDETMDMKLTPLPKDVSILSLRGPLRVRGTFAKPEFGVEKRSLARRIGAAVLLGLIHPVAALLATVETGPGKNKSAPCGELIASLEANVKGGAMKPVPEEQKKQLEANIKDKGKDKAAEAKKTPTEAEAAAGGSPDGASTGASRPSGDPKKQPEANVKDKDKDKATETQAKKTPAEKEAIPGGGPDGASTDASRP